MNLEWSDRGQEEQDEASMEELERKMDRLEKLGVFKMVREEKK